MVVYQGTIQLTYAKLPAPGDANGPCASPCVHHACKEAEEIANTICPICNLPIGYGTRFVSEPFRHCLCTILDDFPQAERK